MVFLGFSHSRHTFQSVSYFHTLVIVTVIETWRHLMYILDEKVFKAWCSLKLHIRLGMKLKSNCFVFSHRKGLSKRKETVKDDCECENWKRLCRLCKNTRASNSCGSLFSVEFCTSRDFVTAKGCHHVA